MQTRPGACGSVRPLSSVSGDDLFSDGESFKFGLAGKYIMHSEADGHGTA